MQRGHGVPLFEWRVGAAWDLAAAFCWEIWNGSAWAPCEWERETAKGACVVGCGGTQSWVGKAAEVSTSEWKWFGSVEECSMLLERC